MKRVFIIFAVLMFFVLMFFVTALFVVACKNAPMTKADIEVYIISSPSGTKENPVQLSLNGFDLGDMRSKDCGWFSLLDAIEAAEKFVSLDLSGCTMITEIFNHRTGYVGKDKIVSLVLPDAATVILRPGPAYREFINVKYVQGSNISFLGWCAVQSWESLESADFPKLTSTGHSAFEYCGNFNIASLPEGLTYLAELSFLGCRSLTLTSIPEGVTGIGFSAFENCIALEEMTLPAALTSLGAYVFKGCTNLRKVTINAVAPPKVDGGSAYYMIEPGKWGMFVNTHPGLEIKVPAGSVQAYKEAEGWREYADRISAM